MNKLISIEQHPAWQTERSSEELYKVKDSQAERSRNEAVIPGKESGLFIASLLSLRGWQESVRHVS